MMEDLVIILIGIFIFMFFMSCLSGLIFGVIALFSGVNESYDNVLNDEFGDDFDHQELVSKKR